MAGKSAAPGRAGHEAEEEKREAALPADERVREQQAQEAVEVVGGASQGTGRDRDSPLEVPLVVPSSLKVSLHCQNRYASVGRHDAAVGCWVAQELPGAEHVLDELPLVLEVAQLRPRSKVYSKRTPRRACKSWGGRQGAQLAEETSTPLTLRLLQKLSYDEVQHRRLPILPSRGRDSQQGVERHAGCGSSARSLIHKVPHDKQLLQQSAKEGAIHDLRSRALDRLKLTLHTAAGLVKGARDAKASQSCGKVPLLEDRMKELLCLSQGRHLPLERAKSR
eukprot:scaffold813_cov259-Pinguiococcus_pyrenoidosus.AAC.3